MPTDLPIRKVDKAEGQITLFSYDDGDEGGSDDDDLKVAK